VAGIHCLQKVERFGSAHFADDDPLGAHTQAVFHEIAPGLLQLEFGGVSQVMPRSSVST
jgi:hypothetical protein